MRFNSIADVIGIVVGWVVDIWSRVKSRGCYMYRGDAAQISVDKYWLRLNS